MEPPQSARSNLKYNETQRDFNRKRPLSSAKFRTRPQTGVTKLPLMQKLNILQDQREEFIKKDELDPLYLMIKNSPTKYDMKSVNTKYRRMSEMYLKKLRYQQDFTKTDEVFFKYNVLYGNKSPNLIRNYSPKMRPLSVSNTIIKKDDSANSSAFKCFNEEEMKLLFLAKCQDLNIKIRDNLEYKFYEYCNKKCINRIADFSECNLAGNFAYTISEILKFNDKISRLYFSKNCFGDEGVKLLMEVLKKNLNIIHLDLSSNDITYRGSDVVFSTLMNQHSLISLDLSSKEGINRNRLSHEGVKLLEELLKVNHLLEYLYLSGNSVKNEGLKYILTGLAENKTLQTLHLSNNEITHYGINYFKTVLKNTKLMDLDISDNTIGDEGMEILSDIINENQIGYLKKLNVSNCKIDFSGFYRLIFALESNKRLEVLNFSKNNLFSDKFPLLKPNLMNTNLRDVNLSKCKIGNQACRVIGDCLLANNSIKILNLSDNKIDDKGFRSFDEVPAKNHGLENLDVSKNLITDTTAKNFAKNLESNFSLKTLNFYDNQLRNETGTVIIESLRKNKNLLKINIKYNRMQLRIMEEIKRLIKGNRDNYKKKYIPNLKKEIKNNYITSNDFENTDMKIRETGINVGNLSEKLKEDSEKYTKLKKEEEKRINLVKNKNETINKELAKCEELTKKILNEVNLIQISSAKEAETITKETSSLFDKIRNLEIVQRDLKNEQDKIRFQFEYEINKIQGELKSSEERLNLAVLSSESLKKELEDKKKTLELLMNPKPSAALSNNNGSNTQVNNNTNKDFRKSLFGSVVSKKTETEINMEEIQKNIQENNNQEKAQKNNANFDANKKRAKSANPRKNLKSATTRITNINTNKGKNEDENAEKKTKELFEKDKENEIKNSLDEENKNGSNVNIVENINKEKKDSKKKPAVKKDIKKPNV